MNQYECARRWASETRKPYGKAGHSMFYEDDTIYSYGRHWPLARKVTLPDTGRTVALMNDVYYSSSTARHRCHVARAIGYRYESVEHDLFHTVSDEKSLAAAVRITHERLLDRQYEAKQRDLERARRDRENNGESARDALEKLLDVDLDDMSGSAAAKLRNLLIGVPRNNFRAYTWHGSRNGGLAEQYPALVDVIAATITEDPSVLKRPGFLFTLIENFKLLAA